MSVEQGDKSSVNSGRRRSRKLLIEDAFGELRKVPGAWFRETERRSSVYQLRHDPIAARHFGNRPGKRLTAHGLNVVLSTWFANQ